MHCRSSLFRRSLLPASLLAGFQNAFAQTATTAASADESADTLPPVLITDTGISNRVANENGYKAERTNITGVNTLILDTPYSIDVVTQQQLEDKRPETLEEAVKGISGLSQGNNLAGTLDTVVRRGYGGNRDGSIMRNGMASALARNFTATAERVEVLKGPASVLYGLQNPGGIINVVSKKPNHTEHKNSISASYGSNANRQVGLDLTGPIGNTGLAYRFIADYKSKDYWRNFGKNTEYVIAPSLSWQNDRTKVLAAYEYQDYEGVFDRGTFLDTNATRANGSSNPNYLKPINAPLETRLDDPINVTKGYAHTFQLSGEHKLSPAWTLQGEYGYSRNHYSDWQARVTGHRHTRTGEQIRHRIDSTNPSDVRVHSLNLAALGTFAQGSNIVHKMRAAVQLQDYKLTLGDLRRSGTYWVNLADFLNGTAYGSARVRNGQNTAVANASGSDTLEQYKTAAFLLQDSVYIGDQWIVSGALRAQYHKIHSGQGRPASFRNNSSDFDLLPQLGAVYLINPSWSVYGNFGTSMKPNASRNVNYYGQKVPSEKSRQFEVGTKYNGENLSAYLALFHIKKDNVARPVLLSNGDYETRVIEKNRSRGVEVDINGKITDKLGISANYTYTDTKILQDINNPWNVGKSFDSMPKHMGGLLLTYDFGDALGGKWRAGAGADYLGSWGFGYNNTWIKMPSATVYNAFMSYDTKVGGKDLNIRLTGKNLGNKRYFVSHTSATMEHLSIGAAREIGISAKLSF